MKRIMIILIACTIFMGSTNLSDTKNDNRENFINDLIEKMTLEEKVGQMTQVTLEVVTHEGNNRDPLKPISIDMDKLREAILKYKVGSILNTGGAANSIEAWHNIITKIQNITTKESNLGIPVIFGIDAIHGANYTLGATLFPQSIAMAATRNRALIRKEAEITAYEIRASGIPWNFNPVLGLAREPLWPRFWETYGEDTYLASELGVQYVNGLQGNDMSDKTKAAACVKHYLGYSVPKNGQDRTPAWIPERILRDIFLPPFAAGIKAGASTVMVNSSEINGIPVHSDYYLLTDIIKNELKFDGFIVSDWADVKALYERDRVAETPKEAVKLAVMAGVDMSMVPYDYSFAKYLIELVNEKQVPVERINDAVKRILGVKYDLGLFDDPYPNKELLEDFASEKFTETNLTAAQEAITLLKNENEILPLSSRSKVLVTGPTGNHLMNMNGGWSTTWQGNIEGLYPQEKNTFYEAVQEIVGAENCRYIQGTSINSPVNIKEVVEAAENFDVIIACLGEDPYCETPGNIHDLTLNRAQLNLVHELSQTGKPIILVLFEGRPRVINEIVDEVSAIVMGYLPGMEGGDATADIIFGDVNPSGKLPFTYPKYSAGYTTYDHKPIEKINGNTFEPQWTFGHGLSYTQFEYSDLVVTSEAGINDNINVTVKVKNIGEIAGKEAVELYITDLYGSVSRPVKQLKGFEKIYLEPGENKTVQFVVKPEQLAFHNRENKKVVEPGEFIIMIDKLSKSIILK